jgi:hypothetical protein
VVDDDDDGRSLARVAEIGLSDHSGTTPCYGNSAASPARVLTLSWQLTISAVALKRRPGYEDPLSVSLGTVTAWWLELGPGGVVGEGGGPAGEEVESVL